MENESAENAAIREDLEMSEVSDFSDSSGDHSHLSESECFVWEFDEDEFKEILSSDIPEEVDKLYEVVYKIVVGDRIALFKKCIRQGYKIDILNEKNQTAAHVAFYKDSNNIFKYMSESLIDLCASSNNYTDCYGLSHLHIACMMGNIENIQRYLDNGADINMKTGSSLGFCSGFTPIQFAVMYNNMDALKLLLERKADINAKDFYGRTVLHTICRWEIKPTCLIRDLEIEADSDIEVDIIKVLVDGNVDINAKDSYNDTALLFLFSNYYYFRCEFMDSDLTNAEIIDLITTRQKKQVELLLGYGADVSVINKNGDSVLHKLLIELRPSRFPSNFDEISFDDEYSVEIMEKVLSISPKVDINAINNRGQTPIQLAIENISTSAVSMLLKHGADATKVKLDHTKANCFRYPSVLPNLDAVRGLIKIADLMLQSGHKLSLENNLAILKFLVHNPAQCGCRLPISTDSVQIEADNFVTYSSSEHTYAVLRKNPESFFVDQDKFTTVLFDYLKRNVFCRQLAGFHVDEEIVELLELPSRDCIAYESCPANIAEEINRMKSFKINHSVTLYEMMKRSTKENYLDIREFDVSTLGDNFNNYRNIIIGHVTHSLIRYYLQNSTYDYVIPTFFPFFPYACLRQIIDHLNNEDILNFCMASMIKHD